MNQSDVFLSNGGRPRPENDAPKQVKGIEIDYCDRHATSVLFVSRDGARVGACPACALLPEIAELGDGRGGRPGDEFVVNGVQVSRSDKRVWDALDPVEYQSHTEVFRRLIDTGPDIAVGTVSGALSKLKAKGLVEHNHKRPRGYRQAAPALTLGGR